MKILFIPVGDQTQASSRLRVYEIISHLEQRGITCNTIKRKDFDGGVLDFVSNVEYVVNIIRSVPNHNIVYIQKLCFPTWFVRILSFMSDFLVYDFDDAIYTSPPGKKASKSKVKRLNETLRKSDLIVAGSEPLADYANCYNNNVSTITTGIPRKKYQKNRKRYVKSGKKEIILGWVGNPENLCYLADIEDQIEDLLQENENLKMRIITSEETPLRPLKKLESHSVKYIEWELDTALSELAQVDIGLRPLRNDEWTRSKGGFTSIVECLALGIPVVASPVGMVSNIITPGYNGELVHPSLEWKDIIEELVKDRDQLEEMSLNAVESVSEMGFWSENKSKELENILYALSS